MRIPAVKDHRDFPWSHMRGESSPTEYSVSIPVRKLWKFRLQTNYRFASIPDIEPFTYLTLYFRPTSLVALSTFETARIMHISDRYYIFDEIIRTNIGIFCYYIPIRESVVVCRLRATANTYFRQSFRGSPPWCWNESATHNDWTRCPRFHTE